MFGNACNQYFNIKQRFKATSPDDYSQSPIVTHRQFWWAVSSSSQRKLASLFYRHWRFGCGRDRNQISGTAFTCSRAQAGISAWPIGEEGVFVIDDQFRAAGPKNPGKPLRRFTGQPISYVVKYPLAWRPYGRERRIRVSRRDCPFVHGQCPDTDGERNLSMRVMSFWNGHISVLLIPPQVICFKANADVLEHLLDISGPDTKIICGSWPSRLEIGY